MEDGEARFVAERARAVQFLHGPDARLTVVVAAAADEMRLSQYLETHRALAREQVGRRGDKLAGVPAFFLRGSLEG